MLKWKINKLKGAFFSRLPINDKNNDIQNSYVICGLGRSGTTWVSEVINHKNEFRDLFEPLNQEKIKEIPFSPNLYLRKDDSNEPLKAYLSEVLKGEFRNPWIDRFNRNLNPNKRLVKFIRINLLFSWFTKSFPTLKIVYITRNPFDVVKSRINKGWPPNLHHYLNQKKLVDDYLGNHLDFINNLETDFQKHFTAWCISMLPIYKNIEKNVLYLNFEDLKSNPKAEFKKIYDHFELQFNEISISKIVTNPSTMTSKNSNQLSSNVKESINQNNLNFGIETLKRFGIKNRWT